MNDTERLTAYTRRYSAEELYAKGYADGYENGRMSKEPVFFPPCEDCNKKMDEVRRAYDKVQAGINNTVEELEKIKTEIDNCLIHNPDYNECNVNMGLGISYEIIKKHIAKLKGENK